METPKPKRIKQNPPTDIHKLSSYITPELPQHLVSKTLTRTISGSQTRNAEIDTEEARRYAAQYAREMIDLLVDIARDPASGPQNRRGAAKEILDRGVGKPLAVVESQSTTMDLGAMSLEALKASRTIVAVTKPSSDDDEG